MEQEKASLVGVLAVKSADIDRLEAQSKKQQEDMDGLKFEIKECASYSDKIFIYLGLRMH